MLTVSEPDPREYEQLLIEIAALTALDPSTDPKLLHQHVRERMKRVADRLLRDIPRHDRDRITARVLVILILNGQGTLRQAAAAHGAGEFLARVCRQARRSYYQQPRHEVHADKMSLDERLDAILSVHTRFELLSDQDKQSIYDVFVYGEKIEEIARKRRVSFSEIARRLFKFISQLRDLLS